ncbi:MAG: ATP-dependent DNA helicase PcrA [Candidatus Latescibacterota bacterium]|nr:MAG: ATP-dependent DNA helicase PcrA [Candidatus Latescibacterota bacterium]
MREKRRQSSYTSKGYKKAGSILTDLNPVQREAVQQAYGPLLILAGAGSGKTRVLTYKVAYLVRELRISPRKILAVTFTNKAAQEMKQRIEQLVGTASLNMWISTFHSICARILRREAGSAGVDPNFVIYDTDDQLTVVKKALEKLKLSREQFSPKMVLSKISWAKNSLISPQGFTQLSGNFFEQNIARIYQEYQKGLAANNALDFDDLLMKTAMLFDSNPSVLEKYQQRFQFILVDEYQDTNHAQYVLVKQLASRHRNLCVVGDDDQSIYGWRGADIRNILDFERDYPEAKVIRLEQNYRSTKRILEAASAVVKNNLGRKGKTLWTQKAKGDKLTIFECADERDEAERIVETILEERGRNGRSLNDFVILYRTNAQSRALEDGLRRRGLPYTIVGGLRFYERKEVKDILAYLKLICNPRDSVSLNRIINVPRRGIGQITVGKVEEFATGAGISLLQALMQAEQIEGISAATKKRLKDFAELIDSFAKAKETTPADRLAAELVERIGYLQELRREGTLEAQIRADNIQELLSGITEFVERSPDSSLDAFLAEVSLLTDIDRWDESRDAVTLMTLHCAKGLEFPIVFIAGLEEGLFPLSRSVESLDELEEERRLFYVGITRAKEKVFLSFAYDRHRYNSAMYAVESRFIKEIPSHLLQRVGLQQQWKTLMTEELPGFQVGSWVIHPQWGRGKILSKTGFGENTKLAVYFDTVGEKRLLVRYAELEPG